MISIKDNDGSWFKQQDMWKKYLRRPMKALSDISFTQFAKMYTSAKKVTIYEESKREQ